MIRHVSSARVRRAAGMEEARSSTGRSPATLRYVVLATLGAALSAGCGSSSAGTQASGLTVSGTVSGEAKAGVTITLSGQASAVTTTDGSGAYAFKGLSGGRYLATASLAGYTFAPFAGRQIELAGANVNAQDFIATATSHDIRGRVSGVTVAGVQITLTGATSATTTTSVDGTYSFLGVIDGTYTVTPSHAGDGFTPGARTVTLSGGDASGQDFTASSVTAPVHTIAGVVSGAVTSGVTLKLQDASGNVSTTTTDAAGAYAFPALPDGAYSLCPVLTGYTFVPRSLAVTLHGADALSLDFAAATIVTPGGGGGGGGGGTVGDPRVGELATAGHVAYGIAIGNDLNAWITDDVSGTISQVILQDGGGQVRGDVKDTASTPAGAEPTAIALRYFGLRCFTETQANRLACLDWNGALSLTVDIPTPASRPVDVINGPGSTPLAPDMWFAEHDAGKVGRMSIGSSSSGTTGTVVAEYSLPSGCNPTALTWANDGNVWWAAEGCRRIGWIDPATGAVHTVEVDVGRPVSLTLNLGETGVWFVDAASDRLGRLTAAGGLSWFSPPVAGSGLTSVTLGPDQAVYVTESGGNAIARFPLDSFDPNADPNAGRLTEEFALPTAGAEPFRITSGGDGNVWFTERGQAKIGVVYLPTHCLEGLVTLPDMTTAVPGVTLTLGSPDGSLRTTSTAADGSYRLCGLAAGTYTLTPSAASTTFTPASLTTTLSTSNLFGRDFVAQ